MSDRDLRRHLVGLLTWESAHVGFDRAVADLAPELYGRRAEGLPHTAWELVEHLRLAQHDIVKFSKSDHESPPWPEGYWPAEPAPPSDSAWEGCVERFRRDLGEMVELIEDPATDLVAVLPWSEEATVLREALLLADHNAYHVGQLVQLRRALGAWGD